MKTILLLALACVLPVAAQQFSINWFTIDGGGGTSTGGTFSVSGTVGQPDAGRASGGNFAVEGGFWSVVQTPGAPTLHITNGPSGVVVYWERPATGFVLEHTPTLTGSPLPWAPVLLPYQTNATHIYVTEPSPSGVRFFRLRGP
jgi:hypothetical protein